MQSTAPSTGLQTLSRSCGTLSLGMSAVLSPFHLCVNDTNFPSSVCSIICTIATALLPQARHGREQGGCRRGADQALRQLHPALILGTHYDYTWFR